MSILEKTRSENSTEKPQVKTPGFREEMAKDIKTNRIEGAAPDLFKLAQKIVESKVTYDLVISDDASGRLVSLFLKKILDVVQEKRGQHKPDIRFIGGIDRENEENVTVIMEELKKIAPIRTLLITEFISSGESIERLTKILQKLNLKFDLAVLSGNPWGIKRVSDSFSNQDFQLYLGSEGNAGLDMYQYVGSGVRKIRESPFLERNTSIETSNRKKEIRRKVKQSREDINLLAQETLKELGF